MLLTLDLMLRASVSRNQCPNVQRVVEREADNQHQNDAFKYSNFPALHLMNIGHMHNQISIPKKTSVPMVQRTMQKMVIVA